MFLGAVHASRDLRNPDHLAHAAFGMRELLDHLPQNYEGAPVRISIARTSDQLTTLLEKYRKTKKKSGSYVRPTGPWNGDIDVYVRDLLMAMDQLDETKKNEISRTRRTEMYLDYSTAGELGEAEKKASVALWADHSSYFNAVAHHEKVTTIEEFEIRLTSCVNFLVQRMRPAVSDTFNAIDQLISEEESSNA